jgi:hypothetical protein
VVGDQGGLLIQLLAVNLFECLRDSPVDAPSAIGELRQERDLLRQGVLEGVLDLGIQRFLVEKLHSHQGPQRIGQIQIRQLDDALQDGLWERLSNDRGVLQDSLVALRQSVDTRGKDGLNGGRDRNLVEALRKPIGSSLPHERL